MSKLKLVAYNKLKKIVESQGYTWQKYCGSHHTFKNTNGQIIVIPNHGSQVIVRPLLRKILNDINLSIDDYNSLLEKI
jgi:predicted RNA binding protein YcfA (HicA-like mRNA interferase family)